MSNDWLVIGRNICGAIVSLITAFTLIRAFDHRRAKPDRNVRFVLVSLALPIIVAQLTLGTTPATWRTYFLWTCSFAAFCGWLSTVRYERGLKKDKK